MLSQVSGLYQCTVSKLPSTKHKRPTDYVDELTAWLSMHCQLRNVAWFEYTITV